jgi:hypothetical protein
MIREFAIEPEVMATWQHFRELWDDFGASRGRLIAEYPSDWREKVCRRAYEISSAKAASIAACLKPPPGQTIARKWIPTTRQFDKGKDWLTNAERHEPPDAFAAVIAARNPREKTRVLVAGEFAKDRPPWLALSQLEIPRTSAALLGCAGLLVSASDELVLVEPNFKAELDRFRDPFSALINHRPAARPWRRCEVHVECPTDNGGKVDTAALGNRTHNMRYQLVPLIPAGTRLRVFFWRRRPGGKRLHPRFILTELGGLQPDYGLDEGDATGDTTIVSLMAEDVWRTARADYCSASQSFDGGTGCVAEIEGEA